MRPPAAPAVAVLLLCVTSLAAYPADAPAAAGDTPRPALAPAPASGLDRPAEWQGAGAPPGAAPPGSAPDKPASAALSGFASRARRVRKLRKTTTPPDVLEGAESGAVVVGRTAVNAAATTVTANASTVAPATATPATSEAATTVAVPSTTASPSPTTTASSAPPSPTTLRAKTTSTTAAPAASSTTTDSTSTTVTAASSAVPYRGRGKFRLTTTSTEVPDVEHVERDAAGAVVMTDALYNHFRPLQREVPDNDHLTSFHEFGRKITSDPTRSPVAAGSPGTNLIVESTTWGRSVLRRVSPASSSAAPVDRKGRKTEEETHEEMDVGFDRQVVEKNKLATRRRDSARTIENLVILGSGGAGSTPTSVKKAARRKFVVTRKALLSNATDAPANVTHLEPVASVWSTTLPPPRPAPTTELLSTSSTVAPQTELSAPSGGDADSLETTPPPSAAPRRTLEMTSSKEAMLSKAQQRGRTAQLDVHRMVQELREVQEPVQQSSAPALQSARPDVPAVPAEARPTSEPPLHRAQDIAKVAAPSAAPSPAPSAAPGPAADNATDAYVLRRFEEPSGGTPPTELGFIKPPKSQIPYAFVVGRSSSADDVEVMQPLVGPRLAPVAYAEPPRRPEVVEAVVTSVSVKQPSPPATSAAPAAPATPGPAEEQVSLASPVSTENLQDVIKIFFNNTAPPTPEPPVTEVPPPVLPLAVEEKPVVTVVTNTSEVSVVLPTSTPSPSPTPSPRPLRYRSTTTTLAPTPTRVRSTTSPQDAATPPTSAPPASATTSTTTSAPPAATARAEVATPTPSTPLSSTPASSTPASPSTTPPSPTPSPTTPASEAESPTPFIIHVLPSEGTAVEAKPRAIWRDTTPTSTTTSTTTTSTTSTTTSTTTPAPTPPPAPSTEPPTAPSSTTTTTTTTTPPPVEVEEEVIVASAAPKLDSQPPAPPHSDPPVPVEEESAVASAAPKLDSQPPAPPRSNPPVPVSAESIRLRSNKQRPIPVPKEVFKTMTTVAPSASAAPAADGEGGEMTVPPATSTTTEAPKAVFQQPRPNITPVQKGQLGRGQAGAGGRGRGQDGAPSDADPLLLSAKGRGRAVSKQDFALMDQDAKRVPTERELGVVPPGVGVLTYVLLALGVVPLALASVCTARYFINRRKKVLDESDSSSELSCHRRARVGRPDVAATAKLPRPLPHLPTPPTPPKAWEDSDLEREKRDQREQRDQQRDREWDRDRVLQMPAPTRWEFPRDKLRLQTLLGQGNFGQVWKAEADDISGHHGLTRLVAVKTVKEGASVREREDLLQELGIMQQLGAHPNVVTLLGCCTEKEPFLLIMEYVMYGKLLAFLRDHRTRQDYYNFSEDSDALTSRDLTVFAFCVARGMEYLASKGVIHRDLAARNVLVDHNKLCKIADFGMSRSVRDSSCGQVYEQRENKGALPIRWMAPESLIYSVFTHKSDVWSFGILMWEIVTLGSTPYPTMGAREVLRRVRDGYRLERPAHCRPELFRIVLRCWHADPAKRPDFAELRRALADLLEDGVRAGSYVDLEGFAMDSKAGNAAGGGVCREDGRGGGGSSAPVLLNPLGNALRDEANV